ncbi:MAG TPA: dienelactone hydrolase family protein [Anaerolineales bacterium]
MNQNATFGPVSGYLSGPSSPEHRPAIIVIQEWWGLDALTRSIADRFAALGYSAFAPDLYHGELAQLGDSETASALVEKYAAGAPDELASVYDHLLPHAVCDGRIGAIGFCFGGRMALGLGVRRPLSALCTFYGGRMQVLFDQLNKLRSPVLGLFGDQDRSIPAGTIAEFDSLLDHVGVDHEVVVYPGAGHAFFRDTDPSTYRPEAARDAWARTTSFFGKYMPAELITK